MGSTFSGLEVSKLGLSAHQLALNTTGHNIANADDKNYARQRVNLGTMDPIYAPSFNRATGAGQLGQGVKAISIERIRDVFYDDQIIHAENSKNYWNARYSYLKQIEHIFNEPSDNTLRSVLDKFWASWQELANYPSDMAHREVVAERARSLVTQIHNAQNKLTALRQRANQEVQSDVEQINSLAADIRDLNRRILKLQALGDRPNDLLDRRDAALEKLSALVNVHVGRGDQDELIVFIGEQALVQGEIQRNLTTEGDPSNDGLRRVIWEHNRKKVELKGGHLYGIFEVRDRVIVEKMSQVDTYAINIVDIVNEAHRDGFGLDGQTNQNFFDVQSLSANANASIDLENGIGNYDLNQDGTAELTALFRVTGTNHLEADKRLGISGNLTFFQNDQENTPVAIRYREDDTLSDVIQRINDRRTGIVAYLNHDNQLALKGTVSGDDRRTNFMIRHLEDSGELLVGYAGILSSSGAEGAFDFRRVGEISKLRPPLEDISLTPIHHPALHIELAKAIAGNPSAIATGRGRDVGGSGDYNAANGLGDGSNALIIAAALKQDRRMIGHAPNPEEFYNALISKLGSESRSAEDAVERFKDDLTTLQAMRQSVMGVNLDEEMSNMIQFQHAYNASARMLQVQNEILGVIINQMGV